MKQHWEAIFKDKTPTQVSWFQQQPSLSLRLIQNSALAFDEPIIDVGGGASLLVDRLLDNGYSNLTVLDISSRAIQYARKRLGKQADSIYWIEQDITRFNSSTPVSLWHDRAVFLFLTDIDDRQKYIEALRRSLKSKGHLIIASFSMGGPTRCSGLDVVQYDAEKLMHELGNDFELLQQQNEQHTTPGEQQQTFSYFHIQRR